VGEALMQEDDREFREECFHSEDWQKDAWERLSPWQVILQWTGVLFQRGKGDTPKKGAKRWFSVKIVYAKLASDIRLHFIIQRNRNRATERSVFMILLSTQMQTISQQFLHLPAPYNPLLNDFNPFLAPKSPSGTRSWRQYRVIWGVSSLLRDETLSRSRINQALRYIHLVPSLNAISFGVLTKKSVDDVLLSESSNESTTFFGIVKSPRSNSYANLKTPSRCVLTTERVKFPALGGI
jgi:hypothetical protein